MKLQEKKLNDRITEGFNDLEARKGRLAAFNVICKNEKSRVLQYPGLNQRIRSIKAYSIANVDELVEQATEKLTANGCKVFYAETVADAQNYILSHVKKGSKVIKSKSNVSKEISITHVLEDHGCEVVETDLGDRIVQMAKSRPSHTMAPSIHLPKERVAEIFSKAEGREIEPVIETLVKTARYALREDLFSADYGICGANAIAAETGTVFLVENEGNIRAVTSLPRVTFVLGAINKVVPKLEDAVAVIRGASAWGVGQDIGNYMSGISGPSTIYKNGEKIYGGHGPEEVHVIILDNGRHQAIKEGLGEALYCINCGSCLNYCPIYREIGDRYGGKYLGGIGVLNASFMQGIDKAYEGGMDLCLSCRMCKMHCPNMIDSPSLTAKIRAKYVKQNGLGSLDSKLLSGLSNANFAMNAARPFQGMVLKREANLGSHLKRKMMGIDTKRLLPNLNSMAKEVGNIPKVANPKYKVLFYPGCFIDYMYSSIGKATIEFLTKNGVEVVVPEGRQCCGSPHYTKGDMKSAVKMAKANLDVFSRYKDVDAIITACATCGTAFVVEYPEMYYEGYLDDRVFDVKSKHYDIMEFIDKFLSDSVDYKEFKARVTYHDPCHLARWQGVKEEPRKVLKSVPGVDFVDMEDPDICCGAAGTFCFNHSDFSDRISNRKMEQLKGTGADIITTGCPLCIMQLRNGVYQNKLNTKVMHSIELLNEATKKEGK